VIVNAAAALLISALIDVPFLAQTPDLCGGAAVAMVMRYWGTRDVFPQDFASLVDKSEGGIPAITLTTAVRDRGWQALPLSGRDDDGHADIRNHIAAGRPLIALIAVAPRTFHYVVIVGATDVDVVVHDPALSPYRVLRWSEFDRAWAATNRWLLLMLPPAAHTAVAPAPPRSPDAPAAITTPCGALVDRGIELAIGGDSAGAERALTAALDLCPADPAPRRELAGLRFSQKRWADARRLALDAVRLAPGDTYSWRLAASSAYVSGDTTAALTAWNHAGEPRVDTIDVRGAVRTPQPVIVRATGLEPRAVLTTSLFTRAERRLQALPIASSARLAYTPDDRGAAAMTVFIDERPAVPRGWWSAAALAAHALLYSEVRVDTGGPLRRGDTEYAAWRWSPKRPRVEVGMALPSPQRMPGVMSFDASWERETHATADATTARDTRRRAGLHIADWATGSVRWSAGALLDRFNARTYLTGDASLGLRLRDDHVAVSMSAGWWAPLAGGKRLTSTNVAAAWRSTRDSSRASLSTRAEVTVTSDNAPTVLWPGAGTGLGRNGLIRAHPLLDDDVLTGPVLGQTAAWSSTEYARPLNARTSSLLRAAMFVDVARAWRRLAPLPASKLYVDAGIGLRLRAPGQHQELRIDLAHGLNGGGTVLSAGWTTGWPH
jgi:hypothetical protein